ncbi:MAG: anti-sigma factor antagonist [Hungatella sp.]|nr:anti-sigma factor antagonist [Hungatella sp.]
MKEKGFMYEARGQVLVIHLPKELDHHNCRDLKVETDLLLAENYVTKIVFDFSETRFMDSSGIGVLLNRYKQMERSGGKVAICGAGTQILRVLSIGGVGKLVPRYDSMEAAIAG